MGRRAWLAPACPVGGLIPVWYPTAPGRGPRGGSPGLLRTKTELRRAAGRVWGVREAVSRVQGAARPPREPVGPHAHGQRRDSEGPPALGAGPGQSHPSYPSFPSGCRPLRVVRRGRLGEDCGTALLAFLHSRDLHRNWVEERSEGMRLFKLLFCFVF